MAYTMITTQFDKVSGWTDGPRKPTTTKTEGNASAIQTALTSVAGNVSSLATSEDICIVISNR